MSNSEIHVPPRHRRQRSDSIFASWSAFWAGISRAILLSLRGIIRTPPLQLFAPQPSRLPGVLKVLADHKPTLFASLLQSSLRNPTTDIKTLAHPKVCAPICLSAISGADHKWDRVGFS